MPKIFLSPEWFQKPPVLSFLLFGQLPFCQFSSDSCSEQSNVEERAEDYQTDEEDEDEEDVEDWEGELDDAVQGKADVQDWQVLREQIEERGFKVDKLRAKCSPVCPIENTGCCMARLLSQQDDFKDQPSMLEALITTAGHLCLFLPKFHCELNPIEMVRIPSLTDHS